MKEEASDYLELETIKNLVRKYSQFINFPIYVWSSKVRHAIAEANGIAEKYVIPKCSLSSQFLFLIRLKQLRSP